jgi:hypothetical protein
MHLHSFSSKCTQWNWLLTARTLKLNPRAKCSIYTLSLALPHTLAELKEVLWPSYLRKCNWNMGTGLFQSSDAPQEVPCVGILVCQENIATEVCLSRELSLRNWPCSKFRKGVTSRMGSGSLVYAHPSRGSQRHALVWGIMECFDLGSSFGVAGNQVN